MNYKKITQEIVLGDNPRIKILDTQIDVIDNPQTVELVEKYIQTKTPLHLMGVNADKLNEAKRNEQMRCIINSCGIINADGASVIWASRFLKKPLPERVAGIDLMNSLVVRCAEKGYRIYLLGSRQEVVEKTAVNLQTKNPHLKIAGIHNGYFQETDWPDISEKLKKANPDIVFVGITSPVKEYLIEYLQEKGHRAVFMGVGGSFDVISGKIPRAPLWMQRLCLEWLFRVMQEPRRLFRRYFAGNFIFVASILKERFKKGENSARKAAKYGH
ncbi:N-acetylglucosaminyldiphosphoundecaprenol N-acetyl-beta-D-mannosaminyltransferase [Lachnospiraceae bacterium]|jgi:N-acetylglucosaminyldiphosphoundecaprenol N-acetyl-beta-D-mannosaminyltransferase|nr:N-acetylglucosaminyldiphosphoundecaprenol N-acetyl-beta-D-mannosaminyltransferase [Lachnospiraceae bacterium]